MRMSYREEIARIYRDNGIRGFTRGYWGMFMRDAPGFGLYFMMYDIMKRTLGVNYEQNRIDKMDMATGFKCFLSGGTAGISTWAMFYPFDTVKSIMQSHKGSEGLKARTVFRNIIKEQGVGRLYRGIHVQLLRSFPTSACSMLMYDTIKTYLNNR